MKPVSEITSAGVESAAVRFEPLADDEIRAQWSKNEGLVQGIVAVELSDVHAGFESFLDSLSKALVGHDCLQDINYDVRGFNGTTLYIEVSGKLDEEALPDAV